MGFWVQLLSRDGEVPDRAVVLRCWGDASGFLLIGVSGLPSWKSEVPHTRGPERCPECQPHDSSMSSPHANVSLTALRLYLELEFFIPCRCCGFQMPEQHVPPFGESNKGLFGKSPRNGTRAAEAPA
jgi:hypothetical protein